ncbi:MAG: HEAT repeat domain-containing protein, partial [Myxococcales bacterium]|nr:HEAT repeat domain-containing protein [Myxococcales bacterium]
MEEQVTGAADWRSETEKRKSLLRKAIIALFKIWIPDHPEASMARGEVFSLMRDAFAGIDQICLVSRLSTGVEDVNVYDFLPYQSLSVQDLLVQREGTDAFLDAKNALRVVRRKFGMMTLIARMAGVLEQRNANALTIKAGFDEAELLSFAKLMTTRIEGTAAEEEQAFKQKLRRQKCPHFEMFYHSEMIGRRQPIGWTIKRMYTLLSRQARAKGIEEHALVDFCAEQVPGLSPTHLRQLSLYAGDMAEELDIQGLDPFPAAIRAAEERMLLTATRSIFDDFQLLRVERRHQQAMETHDASSSMEAAVIAEAAEGDFLAETEGAHEEDDEFMRMAQALERIRGVMGHEFFQRISMVSGNLNFLDAATGSGLEGVEAQLAALDPVEGLAKARSITEAFYRARALAAVVAPLRQAGRLDEAIAAAEEALEAARRAGEVDAVPAYSAAVQGALAADRPDLASTAVTEALAQAHAVRAFDERAAALMRVISTLMEAGPLPPTVRSSLSRAILGEEVHFWDKKEVTPPLVEAILALLSGVDDDSLIFLRKVVVHPSVEVRCSVLRTLPFAQSDVLRNMLVSHLKDPDPEVRIEVIERIGTSGDRRLAVYLINHFRHEAATTPEEKRALALNLARMDSERYVALFNAMLGGLATRDDRLFEQQKPLKEDSAWQLAGLEVLSHLNSREAKRLLHNAATRGKGKSKPIAERLWPMIKSRPYGDPTLPRSPHDPQWTEADNFNLLDAIDAWEAAHPTD